MSVDFNALAQALKTTGLTEDDIYTRLDHIRNEMIEILALGDKPLSADMRERMQDHVDVLKPILNPMFRPTGINSDPFVPRFSGHSITYYNDENGLIVHVNGEDGTRVMLPYIYLTGTESEVHNVEGLLRRMAAEWELPFKEPYVAKDEALQRDLEDAYLSTNSGPAI